MSGRVSHLGALGSVFGLLLASAVEAEPLAYVLIHPGSAEGSTALGLLDLAAGDLETVGPLGVTLVDAHLTLSPDGTLYAVDLLRFDVPVPTAVIYRLDRATGAADLIASRELEESVLFLQGLTADARGDLWLLLLQGPSLERYLLFRFETTSLEMIEEGSLLGSFRGLAHRGDDLWTIHGPTQPPSAAGLLSSPSGMILSTVDPSTMVVTPRAPLERIVEPGLSFDARGGLWGLTARSATHRRESFRIDTRSGLLDHSIVQPDPPETIFPGSLAVLPGVVAPAIPTLGGTALAVLIVLLLGAGLLRLRRAGSSAAAASRFG